MRIIVIRHSIRNRGGDRLILDYCSYLIRKGHEIIYWTNEVNTQFSIDPLIQIKRIPYSGAIGTIRFIASTRFVADIVLVDLIVMASFAFILNGRKVVYVGQDDDRMYYSSYFLKLLIKVVYWITLYIFRVKTIAVSDDLTAKLETFAKGTVKSVPNGIDPQKFYREKAPCYLKEKTAPVTIILYARHDFRKGLDIGIKAIEELGQLRGVNDWELWVIGEDIVKINVDGLRIRSFGFLNSDNLRAALSAADIYLSPSRHEGFGLMQLEAMACGCVMVTTRAFSLVENGVNGLVCSVDDWSALAQYLNLLINDRERLMVLRGNGFELAQKFNIEESCLEFERALVGFVDKRD